MVLDGEIDSLLKKEQYTDEEIFEFCKDYIGKRDVYGDLKLNYFEISDEELWSNIDTEFKYAAVDCYVKNVTSIWLFVEEPIFKDFYGDGMMWQDNAGSDTIHPTINSVHVNGKSFRDTLRVRPC
jgi:hypothetical protein